MKPANPYAAAAPPVDLGDCRRVLVVKPSSLGDVVQTLPAVHDLKVAFPHLRLHWVVNPEWAPLLEGNPDLEAVQYFPRGELGGVFGFWKFRQWSKKFAGQFATPPDLALDFQGLLRSAMIARCSRARVIAGLSDAREGAGYFYDHKVEVGGVLHAVGRYRCLVAGFGVEIGGEPEFVLPAGRRPEGMEDEWLGAVVLHPYSRGRGKSLKRAEVERFCRALAPVRVVVVGRGAQGENLPGNALSLVNRTDLIELIWVLRNASAVVSVDSGPMHIAAALGVRLLSLHAWTDPRRVGPLGVDAMVWKAGRLLAVSSLARHADLCGLSGPLDAAATDAAIEWARD